MRLHPDAFPGALLLGRSPCATWNATQGPNGPKREYTLAGATAMTRSVESPWELKTLKWDCYSECQYQSMEAHAASGSASSREVLRPLVQDEGSGRPGELQKGGASPSIFRLNPELAALPWFLRFCQRHFPCRLMPATLYTRPASHVQRPSSICGQNATLFPAGACCRGCLSCQPGGNLRRSAEPPGPDLQTPAGRPRGTWGLCTSTRASPASGLVQTDAWSWTPSVPRQVRRLNQGGVERLDPGTRLSSGTRL